MVPKKAGIQKITNFHTKHLIMETTYWIDYFSIPLLFILTVVLVFGAILAGRAMGAWMKEKTGGTESIGSVVGATLGFLAFLLAFTFNMAANRYDSRKSLMVEELNAIDATYRRAGLLPEQASIEIRSLLKEYIDLRVSLAQDPDKIQEAITRSEQIQNELWAEIEQVSAETGLSINHSLYYSFNKGVEKESIHLQGLSPCYYPYQSGILALTK